MCDSPYPLKFRVASHLIFITIVFRCLISFSPICEGDNLNDSLLKCKKKFSQELVLWQASFPKHEIGLQ